MGPLLVGVNNYLLVDDETLSSSDVLNQDLSRVLRQDVADAVILKLLLCRGNEERIFLVNQEPIEDQLWVSHTLALESDLFVEIEGSHQWYHHLHQEVVRALLTLFLYHFTSTLVQQIVHYSIVLGRGHQGA